MERKPTGHLRTREPRSDDMRLGLMQRRFIRHLTTDPDLDTVEAARKAGYKNPDKASSYLMQQPLIRKKLDKLIELQDIETSVSSAQIIDEIANIAFLDPVDLFYEKNGTLKVKSLKKLTPLQRKLIDKITVNTEKKTVKGQQVENTYITVSSITSDVKLKALTLLMKHKGMLIDKRQEEHVHKVNWDDYYKARQDDDERRALVPEKKNITVEHDPQFVKHKEFMSPPEGVDPEILDAEYEVKELVDELDEMGDPVDG